MGAQEAKTELQNNNGRHAATVSRRSVHVAEVTALQKEAGRLAVNIGIPQPHRPAAASQHAWRSITQQKQQQQQQQAASRPASLTIPVTTSEKEVEERPARPFVRERPDATALVLTQL